MATVQDRLQSIINKANSVTGKTDINVTAATQSLIDGFGGGGGIHDMVIAANGGQSLTNCDRLFSETKFAQETDLTIYAKTNIADHMFSNATGLNKIRFMNEHPDPLSALEMFSACDAKIVDFGFSISFAQSAFSAFSNCPRLTTVLGELDWFYADYMTIVFNCPKLVDLRFKSETVRVELDLSKCPALNVDSLSSVISGLNPGSPACTLYLHPNTFAKLTDQMKKDISAKYWYVKSKAPTG